MDSEIERTIAFLFKRSGKNKLKESEIYLPLSIELRWFSTKQAHEFIKQAINQKILIKKGELLAPNFDIDRINVPFGFYPSKEIFTEEKNFKKENVMDILVRHIVEKTNQTHKEVLERISQFESEKNVVSEVAALLVAKESDIKTDGVFEIIEQNIFRENEE